MAWSLFDYIETCKLFAEAALVVVLAPEFLRYRSERRERRARIGLSLEVFDPRKNAQPVYDLDRLTSSIDDLIDRVKDPQTYESLDAGNEILIVGPAQGGKKTLATHIARVATIDRVIVVYDARDADVLARAKGMLENKQSLWDFVARTVTGRRLAGSEKTMLLLPDLDPLNGNQGNAWPDQLEALIDTASGLHNVLIVGTTKQYDRQGVVATWFGTILPLTAATKCEHLAEATTVDAARFVNGDDEAWNDRVREIAIGSLNYALKTEKYHLADNFRYEDLISRILEGSPTPEEIKDILVHCKTMAIRNVQLRKEPSLLITSVILDTAIERVIPSSSRPLPTVREGRREQATM